MENLSPMRLSRSSQFFINPGLMMGANRPSMAFESSDNMYPDPYPMNDSRNSFSSRLVSNQLPPMRQAANSVSAFPPFGVGESSFNTDWGQTTQNLPILFNEPRQSDFIDKPDRESSRDPAFFNQFLEIPLVREDLDFGNGRKSELSVMDHERSIQSDLSFSGRIGLRRTSAREFPLEFAAQTAEFAAVYRCAEHCRDSRGVVSSSLAGRRRRRGERKRGNGEKQSSAEFGGQKARENGAKPRIRAEKSQASQAISAIARQNSERNHPGAGNGEAQPSGAHRAELSRAAGRLFVPAPHARFASGRSEE